MMTGTRRPLALLMLVLFVLGPVLPIGCSMFVTPAHSVEVQNNSDKPIFVFSRSYVYGGWGEMKDWGIVDPGSKRAVFSMVPPSSESDDRRIQVEARDTNGRVVRKWEFPPQDRILLVVDKADVR